MSTSVVTRLLSQEHTGFSDYTGRRIHYSPRDMASREEMAQLLRYIHKPHVSLAKIEFDETAGRVVYRGAYHPQTGTHFACKAGSPQVGGAN